MLYQETTFWLPGNQSCIPDSKSDITGDRLLCSGNKSCIAAAIEHGGGSCAVGGARGAGNASANRGGSNRARLRRCAALAPRQLHVSPASAQREHTSAPRQPRVSSRQHHVSCQPLV